MSLAAVAPELYDLERVAFRIRELERPEIAVSRRHRHHRRDGDGHSRRSGWRRTGRAESRQVVDRAGGGATHQDRGRASTTACRRRQFRLHGSDEALSAAFEAAGWTSAVALSLRADARTVLAVAEDRGYTLGPVSLETIGGPPTRSCLPEADEHLRSTPPRTHLAPDRGASRRAGMDRERYA